MFDFIFNYKFFSLRNRCYITCQKFDWNKFYSPEINIVQPPIGLNHQNETEDKVFQVQNWKRLTVTFYSK